MNPLNWYRRTLRNPKYRWWIILGSLVYLVSPLDISPDLMPIVGQIDDVAVLTLLISEIGQMLIERVQSRQGKQNNPAADGTNTSGTEQDNTVDVDAVSVD